jgi:predicted TIM-barrel fold metal-dependent hydrolase
MQLVPLLLRSPQTRFDLFHAGWPYHHEAGVIGKHFPNVWLNLCWAWTMNPVTMGEALDAWLDATPHNKIFAFGSDTSHPLCVYAYAMQARDGVARVLQRRMDRGDMDAALAREVAAAILFDNAAQFHRV